MYKHTKQLSKQFRTQSSYLYDRLLHLFISQIGFELPPLAYAIGTLLFIALRENEILSMIYEFLDKKLKGISDDPISEPDLINKTMMLVIYNHICDLRKFQSHIPKRTITSYLEFSQREQWFDSLELALFIKKFANDFTGIKEINIYAEKKMKENLDKQRIDSCAQCIEILGGNVLNSDKMKFVEIIQNWAPAKVPLNDLAWSVIGLIALGKQCESSELFENIQKTIEREISEIYLLLNHDIFPNEVEYQILQILQQYKNVSSQGDYSSIDFAPKRGIEKVDIQGNTILLKINEKAANNSIPANLLALSLWAFILSGNNQIYGVNISKKEELQMLVSNTEDLRNKKKILINRSINYLVNIMGLLLIFVVGVGISFYQTGLLELNIKNFQANYSFISTLIATAVILTIGIISLFKRRTIVLSFSELPIIGRIWKTLTAHDEE